MFPIFIPTSSQSNFPLFIPIYSPSYSSPSYSSINNNFIFRNMMEEEKRKREKERIRQQVNKNFNKDFEEYFKNQIKEIQDKITPDLFQIEPFYIEEMSNLINLMTEEEKCEENLFNEVKKLVSDNAEKNKLVKHLNIILAGPTGAGKSTLINKMLNLKGEKAIKTAIGVPCTMGEPKYYESETVPLLRLADSRGIEKTNYRVKELSESIEKFIKSQLDSENPDLFIHCIWYCITGTRLEQIETDTLKELTKYINQIRFLLLLSIHKLYLKKK